jgi:hypothetical protein
MPIAPDPVDTIERFAELSALLNDPHALRAALLAVVGLDEQAWKAIEQRWMARIRAPGGEVLAQRLSERYAATQRNLSDSIPPTEPGGAPADPPPPPSSTLRSPVPPAPIAGPHPLAGTVDTDVRALRPALPFQPVPAGVVVRPPPSQSPVRSPLADTLDSPEGLPLRPALPFRAG